MIRAQIITTSLGYIRIGLSGNSLRIGEIGPVTILVEAIPLESFLSCVAARSHRASSGHHGPLPSGRSCINLREAALADV